MMRYRKGVRADARQASSIVLAVGVWLAGCGAPRGGAEETVVVPAITGEAGAACGLCESGEYCDNGMSACVSKRGFRDPCSSNGVCETGVCVNGECVQCAADSYCASGICDDGVCAP